MKTLHAVVLLFIVGCAVCPYVPVGDRRTFEPGFTIELPNDWVLEPEEEGFSATRDGFPLQRIRVRRTPADARGSPWKGLGSAPAEECAELAAALFAGRPGGAEVIDVRPGKLAGAGGYRMTLRMRDVDGLEYTTVIVWAAIGGRGWELIYSAPSRHYFEHDLPTFDRAVAGFRPGPAR